MHNQRWEYTKDKRRVHTASSKCLELINAESSPALTLGTCSADSPSQTWAFSRKQPEFEE